MTGAKTDALQDLLLEQAKLCHLELQRGSEANPQPKTTSQKPRFNSDRKLQKHGNKREESSNALQTWRSLGQQKQADSRPL
jgi:hypothetical protein